MHLGSRFTLNLSQLTIQDTLELLYLCKGRITHVESFNLKDSGYGMTSQTVARSKIFSGEAVDITSPDRNYRLMNDLQKALNEGNVIILMTLTNGMYISTHNILRGLPRSAAVGNFFRSILSIPLALLFNSALTSVLHLSMVPGVEQELQKWAAIISKLASDCVAGVIEGLADRGHNVRIRLDDYREKISQLFAVFARLELLFPEEDVLDTLLSPKKMMATIRHEARDLEKVFIVNALDLMYIWMYQSRARKALEKTVAAMSMEEWLIFYRSQLILKRHKEISKVFIDGLVGKNFAKALAFYLARSDVYLRDMGRMGREREKMPLGQEPARGRP